MQWSNFSTLFFPLFCLDLYFFDKFLLLLLYTSLLTAPSAKLDGLPLYSWVALGRLPHMRIIWDYLLTHSQPSSWFWNKPLSHENHLLWSLLRFLCGSSERASVALFWRFDFDLALFHCVFFFFSFPCVILDGFSNFSKFVFSPLDIFFGSFRRLAGRKANGTHTHTSRSSTQQACYRPQSSTCLYFWKGIAFSDIGNLGVRDDTRHRKNGFLRGMSIQIDDRMEIEPLTMTRLSTWNGLFYPTLFWEPTTATMKRSLGGFPLYLGGILEIMFFIWN